MLTASLILSSCYSYKTVVGNGAQNDVQITKWNHYVLAGLKPVDISDANQMANGAENYTVETKQTFINGLLSALSCGIYTPTTTTVTK